MQAQYAMEQALTAMQGTVGPAVSRLVFEKISVAEFMRARCLWPYTRTMQTTGTTLRGGTMAGNCGPGLMRPSPGMVCTPPIHLHTLGRRRAPHALAP